ncbi:MAG: RHS repeat-associated core domain-containing protein [Paenibacillus sp.]|nr:RHS repeat-associated core domain-containing protein [Paenibacillus sp.]
MNKSTQLQIRALFPIPPQSKNLLPPITDSAGEVAATFKYDDWGNLISKTGTIEIPFGYRGKFGYIYDKETGLYFLKSRYYDPEIGRFTSKDRFAGFENRPASQNPYTYCEGDPVNRVDPEGQSWLSTAGAVLGVIGAGFAVVALCATAPAWVGVAAIVVGGVTIIANTAAWLNDEQTHTELALNTVGTIFSAAKPFTGSIALRAVQYNTSKASGIYSVGSAAASKKQEVDWSRYKRIKQKVSKSIAKHKVKKR